MNTQKSKNFKNSKDEIIKEINSLEMSMNDFQKFLEDKDKRELEIILDKIQTVKLFIFACKETKKVAYTANNNKKAPSSLAIFKNLIQLTKNPEEEHKNKNPSEEFKIQNPAEELYVEDIRWMNEWIDQIYPKKGAKGKTSVKSTKSDKDLARNVFEVIPTSNVVKKIPVEDAVQEIHTEDSIQEIPTEDSVQEIPTEDIYEKIPNENIVELSEPVVEPVAEPVAETVAEPVVEPVNQIVAAEIAKVDTAERDNFTLDLKHLNILEEEEQKREYLGEIIFNRISNHPLSKKFEFDLNKIGKVTGVLLAVNDTEYIISALKTEENLGEYIEEYINQVNKELKDSALAQPEKEKIREIEIPIEDIVEEIPTEGAVQELNNNQKLKKQKKKKNKKIFYVYKQPASVNKKKKEKN